MMSVERDSVISPSVSLLNEPLAVIIIHSMNITNCIYYTIFIISFYLSIGHLLSIKNKKPPKGLLS